MGLDQCLHCQGQLARALYTENHVFPRPVQQPRISIRPTPAPNRHDDVGLATCQRYSNKSSIHMQKIPAARGLHSSAVTLHMAIHRKRTARAQESLHPSRHNSWLKRPGKNTAVYRTAVACLLAMHPVTSDFVDGYRSAVSHSSELLDFVLSLLQPLAPDFPNPLTRPDASSFAVHILFGIPAPY